MGFFAKMKNKLGIGGVTFTIEIPGQVSAEEAIIDGKLLLTTKSDQKIKDIKITVYEEFTSGKGDDKTVKKFVLGTQKLEESFEIKTGEEKTVEFSVPFKVAKSSNQSLAEKGGALGALGKLAAKASSEKSLYFVQAEVDVESAVLDPEKKKEFRLI